MEASAIFDLCAEKRLEITSLLEGSGLSEAQLRDPSLKFGHDQCLKILRNLHKLVQQGQQHSGLAQTLALHNFSNSLHRFGIKLEAFKMRHPQIQKEVLELEDYFRKQVCLLKSHLMALHPLPGRDSAFCLRQLIDEALEIAIPAKCRSIQALNLVAPDLAIDAPKHRVLEVVMTLLHNAMDAVKELAEGKIFFESEIQGPHVLLQIRDNGPGANEETLKRMFQLGSTTKASGNGVGLYFAREIMRTIPGGELTFQNLAHGPGAMVTLRLPLQK